MRRSVLGSTCTCCEYLRQSIDEADHTPLSIGESGSPPSFNFHQFMDGEVVAGNQCLLPDESKAVREVSRRYNGLF